MGINNISLPAFEASKGALSIIVTAFIIFKASVNQILDVI
jgi:hypothetical protein